MVLGKLKSMLTTPRPGLFKPDQQDLAKYRREIARRAPASIRYVIWFTARSGSSWLTDIASQTGRLSQPGECFNPAFVPVMAARMNAADPDQYIEILIRRRNTQGVFGCQLTFHDLQATFGGAEPFMRHFRADPCFWLLREDIVLQAVSLAKKQQTRIAHSTQADAAARAAAERDFSYDAAQIKRFVTHLLRAETGTEEIFARYGLQPLRLSYERITAMGAETMVNVIAHHIGAPPIPAGQIASGHSKLGTDRNAEYAARFRAEHAAMMAQIDADRAPRLAAIDRDLPGSLPPEYRPG